MDRDKIIDGLKMTMDLCVFDPSTGEEIEPHLLNDISRATYDACKGALEILERLSTNLASLGTDCSEFPNNSDAISRQAAIDALRYAQHRFTVADEAGGMGTVKWSEYVIYFAAAERVLSDLPPAQPDIIQCRNCKFASGDSRICMKFGHSPIGELDFCSFAERREVTT